MKYVVQILDSNGAPMYWAGYKSLHLQKPFDSTWSPNISRAQVYSRLKDARDAIGDISGFFGVQTYKVIHIADKALFDYKLKGI